MHPRSQEPAPGRYKSPPGGQCPEGVAHPSLLYQTREKPNLPQITSFRFPPASSSPDDITCHHPFLSVGTGDTASYLCAHSSVSPLSHQPPGGRRYLTWPAPKGGSHGTQGTTAIPTPSSFYPSGRTQVVTSAWMGSPPVTAYYRPVPFATWSLCVTSFVSQQQVIDFVHCYVPNDGTQ